MFAAEAQNKTKKTILIADDDEAIARLLSHMLQRDYIVTRVPDGLAAIVKLQQIQLPSLLLLDVNMPKLDGFAVARSARLLHGGAKLPIIFMSAQNAPGHVIKAIQHGARHYVTKPFENADLIGKIKKAVQP